MYPKRPRSNKKVPKPFRKWHFVPSEGTMAFDRKVQNYFNEYKDFPVKRPSKNHSGVSPDNFPGKPFMAYWRPNTLAFMEETFPLLLSNVTGLKLHRSVGLATQRKMKLAESTVFR